MKSSMIGFSIATLLMLSLASVTVYAADEPVKHLNLPDIETLDEAKNVFKETTTELLSNKELNASELYDIHMTTYSLEKAVAYFVENSEGDVKSAATEMADVVELIHLASENNRPEEVRIYLDDYSVRSAAFEVGL